MILNSFKHIFKNIFHNDKLFIISCRKAINACKLLKQCSTTRIPEKDLDNLIDELEKDSVTV